MANPTATQQENDAAAMGQHQKVKTPDGSPVEPSPWEALPDNVAVPVITGTVAVASTLNCSTGIWNSFEAPVFSHQWLRGGSNIAGATTSNYQVAVADRNNKLSCTVTATNSKGPMSATSSETITVP
jgi:hypothetical protein